MQQNMVNRVSAVLQVVLALGCPCLHELTSKHHIFLINCRWCYALGASALFWQYRLQAGASVHGASGGAVSHTILAAQASWAWLLKRAAVLHTDKVLAVLVLGCVVQEPGALGFCLLLATCVAMPILAGSQVQHAKGQHASLRAARLCVALLQLLLAVWIIAEYLVQVPWVRMQLEQAMDGDGGDDDDASLLKGISTTSATTTASSRRAAATPRATSSTSTNLKAAAFWGSLIPPTTTSAALQTALQLLDWLGLPVGDVLPDSQLHALLALKLLLLACASLRHKAWHWAEQLPAEVRSAAQPGRPCCLFWPPASRQLHRWYNVRLGFSAVGGPRVGSYAGGVATGGGQIGTGPSTSAAAEASAEAPGAGVSGAALPGGQAGQEPAGTAPLGPPTTDQLELVESWLSPTSPLHPVQQTVTAIVTPLHSLAVTVIDALGSGASMALRAMDLEPSPEGGGAEEDANHKGARPGHAAHGASAVLGPQPSGPAAGHGAGARQGQAPQAQQQQEGLQRTEGPSGQQQAGASLRQRRASAPSLEVSLVVLACLLS